MTGTRLQPTRRAFLGGSTGALALGALATGLGRARARDFPARNIVITIPTAGGGGADRDLRNFTAVWQNHLDTNVEYEFYPGAAGQVDYEVYVGKMEPGGYNLLFAEAVEKVGARPGEGRAVERSFR